MLRLRLRAPEVPRRFAVAMLALLRRRPTDLTFCLKLPRRFVSVLSVCCIASLGPQAWNSYACGDMLGSEHYSLLGLEMKIKRGSGYKLAAAGLSFALASLLCEVGLLGLSIAGRLTSSDDDNADAGDGGPVRPGEHFAAAGPARADVSGSESAYGHAGTEPRPTPHWFAPTIPRADVTRRLHGCPDGTFVVRRSESQPGSFALSYVFAGEINHELLLNEGAEVYRMRQSPKTFTSIPAAVAQFVEQLSTPFMCRLVYPDPPSKCGDGLYGDAVGAAGNDAQSQWCSQGAPPRYAGSALSRV